MYCRIAATIKNLFKTLVLVESAISKALRLFYFMTIEIWKDIPGYEGLYQASNLGRIKSLKKEWIAGKNGTRKQQEKILSPGITKGYYQLKLHKNKKYKNYRIHQIIAITFLNHITCGMNLVIDHINDNKLDNRVENLQIVTNRFNSHKTQGKYSSKYKGVHLHKQCYKNKIYIYYQSRIMINGKKKSLGYFKNEYDAHLAYEIALKKFL